MIIFGLKKLLVMKKAIFSLLVVFSLFLQTITAQTVKEVSTLPVNNKSGLPYVKDFSGNYSVESFAKINDDEYAFLSAATRKIFIFNIKSSLKVKEISLNFFPVDFSYADNKFFVAGYQFLYTLDINGNLLSKQFIADKISYVRGIKVIKDKICLIGHDQSTYTFDKNGKLVKHNGIILKEGLWAKIEKTGKSSFNIRTFNTGQKSKVTAVKTNENLGTVRIIGLANDFLILEKQVITHEVPLKVVRYVDFYSLKSMQQVSSVQLPDVYYTYLKHYVMPLSNDIEFLISTPDGLKLFRMNSNVVPDKATVFPQYLYSYHYHYNEHTLQANEPKSVIKNKGVKAPITRQQIIDNAEPYAVHSWYCNPENIKDYDCGGVHVTTPDWVQVGENIAIPYMWGGFSSIPQFDQGIDDGVSAGDSYTVGNGAGPSCAVGVDCSGFVSRAWDLPYKYGTSTLPDISTAYSSFSQLKPGDIVNYAGHHVRLVHSINNDGSFHIIESSASGTGWRVGYHDYTTADLQSNYVPRYYNDVIEDATPPSSSITADDWASQDFQATFTDTDDDQVEYKFYHVAYYDGTQWLGNANNGFLHDNFPSGINSQWVQLGSTWTNVGGALNQADETNANTNIYAYVNQEAGNIYLYKWRMKISGSGTNRRAGIYIMSDDPTQTQRNNAYMIYFRVDQDKCQIYKSVNDTIDLKTDDDCIVNADEWFDAKVIYNTNTGGIKVYKDNVLVSSWIDSSPITSGNAVSFRTGEANVSYDDFAVYKSRGNTVTVTVGTNGDAQTQNPDQNTPACLVESIVIDAAGNFSSIASKLVNIDFTPPEMNGEVIDGLFEDEDTTNITTEVSGSWQAATDSNSFIEEYYYCVGTSPYASDIVPWTSTTSLNFVETGLSLQSGTTWYVSVKAVNSAGLESDAVCSDGNTVINANSVENEQTAFVRVYPSLADRFLIVEGIANAKISSVDIYSVSGKYIKTEGDMQNDRYMVDTQRLEEGDYLLKVSLTNGKQLVRKFVIKHN